ncbi:MAG: hypothetical protein COA88_12270 [Kordia sp.]|nr:MAG: hypothetical protein COA88_12270 [Kordia sp.]
MKIKVLNFYATPQLFVLSQETFENVYPFRKAKLVRSKGNKGDYILYYVWNVEKNGLDRKRMTIPKQYATIEERKAFVKDSIKQLNKILSLGYHINENKRKLREQQKLKLSNKTITKKVYTLREAYSTFIRIKKTQQLYKRGLAFIQNTLRRFVEWVEKENEGVFFLEELDFHLFQEYLMYLINEKENAPKTYNNTLGVLHHFYSECLKQKWLKGDNILDQFTKLSVDYETKNRPYTDKQVIDIKKDVLKQDTYLWTVISFIYYSFMRPSELRRLKVGDIDLDKGLIWVKWSISKVKKSEVLPIAKKLKELIITMELSSYEKEGFLLGKDGYPSKQKMGENYMSKHFLKIKKHFGFDKNSDYTLYGFKHTAVVNWYRKEKDIIKIQKMCRHSSVRTTERYLKSLGLIDDKDGIIGLPEI